MSKRDIWQEMLEEDEERAMREDQELNFDIRDADDPEWWKEQDTEMTNEENAAIERLAEIQEERHRGYM